MRASTLIVLLAAIAFGSVAVFLTNVWLAGQQPVAAIVATEAKDTIVVAAAPLRFGDRLTAENLREISWPSASLPAGAFRTRQALLNAEEGERQVITAIGTNEPVLEWKITGAGQRASLSAVLAAGMTAVAIRVDDVLGVAGFVLPGDRVNVLLSRQAADEPVVDVLLQGIKVLAIDQLADDRSEDPTVVRTVTLEVTTGDAQKLTLAAKVGQLSLALRKAAAETTQQTDRITLNDLSDTAPIVSAPEIKDAPERRRPTNAQVGIIRGSERENYNVPIRK